MRGELFMEGSSAAAIGADACGEPERLWDAWRCNITGMEASRSRAVRAWLDGDCSATRGVFETMFSEQDLLLPKAGMSLFGPLPKGKGYCLTDDEESTFNRGCSCADVMCSPSEEAEPVERVLMAPSPALLLDISRALCQCGESLNG
jgi:hypothetical protein